MAETVFILGAGASKESGIPLMLEFLDSADNLYRSGKVDDARESFELVFEARSQLLQVHSKSQMDIRNLESVFTAFEMANTINNLVNIPHEKIKKLKEAMREVIVRTIQERMTLRVNSNMMPEPSKPYNGFVQLLKTITASNNQRQSVAVITFNYDLALDYSFYFNNARLWYGLGENPRNMIPVLKLHGSLNWALCNECEQAIIPWHIQDYFTKKHWSIMPGKEEAHLQIGSNIAQINHPNHQVDKLPFVVPPTWNKASYYQLLSPIWTAAANELKEAENIYIIGYSLPDSDMFFKYFYGLSTVSQKILRRFWIYNPDESEPTKTRYENMMGSSVTQVYKYIPATFSAAIESLRIENIDKHSEGVAERNPLRRAKNI